MTVSYTVTKYELKVKFKVPYYVTFNILYLLLFKIIKILSTKNHLQFK